MSRPRQRFRYLVSVAMATVVVGGITHASAAATDYTFVRLDIQANSASANGINNSSQIVGVYSDDPGSSHGFVLADTLSTIDVPNVRPNSTIVAGINDSGDLVGVFYDPYPSLFPRGFLYSSDFHLFRFTSATEVLGINNDGWMVGRASLGGVEVIMFVLDPDGQPTFFNVFGSVGSWASGINTCGHIVGSYLADPSVHRFAGFVYEDGEFLSVDVPDAIRTYANGINDLDQMVGEYWDASERRHGFLRDPDGTFTTIDFPDGQQTVAMGINNAGQIVGGYVADGRGHAFLANPVPIPNAGTER
jgi:uncharacterized membrane protein